MRKIGEFDDERVAIEFVQMLKAHHISALIEEDEEHFLAWVHDEGKVKEARSLFEEFSSGERKFYKEKNKARAVFKEEEMEERDHPKSPPKTFVYQPYVTKALLILCVLVYIVATIQRYSHGKLDSGQGFYPPIARELFMDYPKGIEIRDILLDRYGDKVKNGENLPPEANSLMKEFSENPPWVGVYNIMLTPKKSRKVLWQGHFLEKVRHGQIWRLFTPVILHMGLLHLLFNMLWLIVLGKMLEFNMGRIRFVLFILATGVISNFCQYVMTGPFFLGISGVLSGFIGFIWMRKKVAPWEVYFIRKETLYFFFTFIFGFFVLQCVAFLLQYFGVYSIPVPIANTAHISGLISGMCLGWPRWFSRKPL